MVGILTTYLITPSLARQLATLQFFNPEVLTIKESVDRANVALSLNYVMLVLVFVFGHIVNPYNWLVAIIAAPAIFWTAMRILTHNRKPYSDNAT